MSLPANPYDGQDGVIRLLSGGVGATDTTEVMLGYNAGRDRWVGEEFCLVRSYDEIGATIQGSPLTTKSYVPLNNVPAYASDFVSIRGLNLAYAAGLQLEYRQECWCSGNGSAINVGCYMYQYNASDWNSPNGDPALTYTIPPTGGVLETAYMNSGNTDVAVRVRKEQGWSTLTSPASNAVAISKSSVYPALYGYMDASPTASGLIYGYAVHCRWVF